MKKFGLFINPKKLYAREFVRKVKGLKVALENNGCELAIVNTSKIDALANIKSLEEEELVQWADIILSLGGDGAYLYAGRRILAYSSKKPIVAINLGSLGFLTSTTYTQFLSTIQDLLALRWNISFRPVLDIFLSNKLLCKALNEALLLKEKSISKMINFSIYLDDEYLVSYLSDGMLVATAAGSTGYALSAGGPIVEPQVNIMLVLPLLSHTIATRPLITSDEREVKIRFKSKEACHLIPDGQETYSLKDEVEIQVKLEKKENWLPILLPSSYNFYNILHQKLWPKLKR